MIRFEHVDKAYDLQAGRRTVFAALRLVTSSPSTNDLFYALTDVSFRIGKGEAFGIIGRNGAGKSTILKIIAGITVPTHGKVTVEGRVSSLIELGAGFHPDLTGRENIYMSGAILGMPRSFIEGKFKEIVDFAELWEFIDVPVKKYSSGMYARLGFAVAVSVEPEILIIDEILSVGDVFFQQKCFTRMREIIKQGTTFIYVTHDTAGMQNLCDRALLLDGGKVEFLGATAEAVNRYYAKVGQKPGRSISPSSAQTSKPMPIGAGDKLMSADAIKQHSILTGASRHGPRALEIVAARVTDKVGRDTLQVEILDILLFHIIFRANENIVHPLVGMNLYDRMGNLVFSAGSPQLKHPIPGMDAGQEIIVQFELGLTVKPGEYTFSLVAAEPTADGSPNVGYFQDQHDLLGPLVVTADNMHEFPFYGIAQLPMKITNSLPVTPKK